MKLFIILSLLVSINVYSAECDTDYVKHNYLVIQLLTSNSDTSKSLGASQRDCLALTMQESESLCPTFRQFEKKFLTLPEEVQITKGKVCFKKMLEINGILGNIYALYH
ncbi:hypothetical protein CXF74_19365 [Psychromonas sp. Urea-02u-13]|nr:hypothetical protein CXF74_19365 [Psychromonas sp. Urea-02u-13]